MKFREKLSKTRGKKARKNFKFEAEAVSIGNKSLIIKKSCRNTGELEKKKLINTESEEDYHDNDDDDASRIYCNRLFSLSKSKEKWICCNYCKKWAHCVCADRVSACTIPVVDDVFWHLQTVDAKSRSTCFTSRYA